MVNYHQKINKTDKLIEDTLLSLMNEKPLAKISINQICNRAEINRSTFYRHFDDKYLVLEKIEAGLLAKFFSISSNSVENSINIEELAANLEQYIDTLLDMIQNDRKSLSIILGKNGDSNFHSQLTDMLTDRIRSNWKKISHNVQGNLNNLDTDLAINFIVAADMAIVMYTLDNPDISHATIKKTFAKLLIKGPLNTIYDSLMTDD
ncbi:TetR/AcrR family transcriptional regulator [Fructilactobacillus sp. Tb1]|uniref:TetR/AcrR family transcriptional regulator n=1 Tax=Fructilactobacillus sp. Tb1 TaxID=3422304 RepID=UPI003D2DB4E3